MELLLPHTINAYYGILICCAVLSGQSLNEGKVLFNEPMLCGQTEKQLEYTGAAISGRDPPDQQNTPIDQLKPLEEIDYSR